MHLRKATLQERVDSYALQDLCFAPREPGGVRVRKYIVKICKGTEIELS